MTKKVKSLFFFLFLSVFCIGQKRKVIVVDEYYQPIPFYALELQSKKFLSNAVGEILLDSTLIDSTLILRNDSLIKNDYHPTIKLSFTSYQNLALVRDLCKNSSGVNLSSFAPFKYDAYNKFFISSRELKTGINWFNDKILSKAKFKVQQTNDDRHIVLSESISNREYLDPLHEEEVVKWSQLSGVDQALFLTLNSQLQSIDVYKKHIKILSAKYVNPFHREATSGYHYSIVDSLYKESDELIKIAFYPKRFSRFESVKGYAWISTSHKAITALYLEPFHSRKMKPSYAIEFKKKEEHYIPAIVRTTLVLDNISSSNLTITANQISYITGFEKLESLHKYNFSDLALTYSDQEYKNLQRTVPLTLTDSNTYKYFENGEKLKINNALKWGENLYFGKVYTKYFNIHLPELITFNRHEKFRLGLALSSNDKLSEHFTLKGNLAYGFGDNKWKYGIETNAIALDNHRLELFAKYSDDIVESGKADRTITEKFHSSEMLRQFQLGIFDRQQGFSFKVRSKPMKYFTTEVDFNTYKDTPLYNYSYKGENSFNVRELNFHFRFAYGERYFRFYNERISFKSKYPILWLHLDKSIANSNINFFRTEVRARYTHEFIINGTSKIEFVGGKYFGDLPYFKLFNGLGAARMKSSTHGAFETMEYNEFTADQYAILFLSHDFGYFNLTQNKTFRPKLELAFNYGLGTLSKPEDHQHQTLVGFNKGYSEAGLAVNDLLLFYPAGIKIGLGVSFYHRLSYRHSTFGENSIFKFTLGFVV